MQFYARRARYPRGSREHFHRLYAVRRASEFWIAFLVPHISNRATFTCGTNTYFGVGGELDARIVGPIFLTEKSGAKAHRGGWGIGTSIIWAERRARHCWRSRHTLEYVFQTISPDYSARHVDLSECEGLPDVDPICLFKRFKRYFGQNCPISDAP